MKQFLKKIWDWMKNGMRIEINPFKIELREYDVGQTLITVYFYDGQKKEYGIRGTLGGRRGRRIHYSEELAKSVIIDEGKGGFVGVSPNVYVNTREIEKIELKTESYILER